jgi:hypothetical protein
MEDKPEIKEYKCIVKFHDSQIKGKAEVHVKASDIRIAADKAAEAIKKNSTTGVIVDQIGVTLLKRKSKGERKV